MATSNDNDHANFYVEPNENPYRQSKQYMEEHQIFLLMQRNQESKHKMGKTQHQMVVGKSTYRFPMVDSSGNVFQNLMSKVVYERPDDPLDYMKNEIQRLRELKSNSSEQRYRSELENSDNK